MKFRKSRPDGTTAAITPPGELTLHRARSDAEFDVLRGHPEIWRLELDGRPLAELPDFGEPAYGVSFARRGAVGTFDGAELRVSARDHLLRSRRHVEFRSGGRTLRIVRRGLAGSRLLEDGRPVARTRSRAWDSAEPDPLRVVAMAVYTWAKLNFANTDPVLRFVHCTIGTVLNGF
ncbi:hypothetical protein ACFV1L_11065 [Kitasatospora sp. NPDC059646]|uniref:hypothetical protein n=1 Tax=Kitasatospora sp. NPDC059646 TaxID=3346893 RepID=UPI003692D37A